MNAHTRLFRRALKYLIPDLAHRYNNPWNELQVAATAAAELGHPAYWSNTTYSQATQQVFALSANKDGLTQALRSWVDPAHPLKTAEALLAVLVPLNSAAAAELRSAKAEAYWTDAPGAREAAT